MLKQIFLTVLVCINALAEIPAQDAVVDTNEWDDAKKPGWIYTVAIIDPDPIGGASPSGGSAFRHTLGAGTFSTSSGGGTAAFMQIPATMATEGYVGWWIKISDPFDWNPIATKIQMQVMRNSTPGFTGHDNFTFTINSGGGLGFTTQLWPATNTQNRYPNRGSITFQKGTWYWFEYYVKLNTVGQSDGIIKAWVNNELIMEHADVLLRMSENVQGEFKHLSVWGGGGGTINQTQHIWVDHTVFSTAPIGMPGKSAPDPGTQSRPLRRL
jgi:hypothetical protein